MYKMNVVESKLRGRKGEGGREGRKSLIANTKLLMECIKYTSLGMRLGSIEMSHLVISSTKHFMFTADSKLCYLDA